MTESSTLTISQELFNKLGTQHPGKQILKVIERIEKLEGMHTGTNNIYPANDQGEIPVSKGEAIAPFIDVPIRIKGDSSLTRSEKMKAAWAIRKAKKNAV